MIKFIGAYLRVKTSLKAVKVLPENGSLTLFKAIDNGFIAVSYNPTTCLYEPSQGNGIIESISSRSVEAVIKEFENVAKEELIYLRRELGAQNVIVDFGYLSK